MLVYSWEEVICSASNLKDVIDTYRSEDAVLDQQCIELDRFIGYCKSMKEEADYSDQT